MLLSISGIAKVKVAFIPLLTSCILLAPGAAAQNASLDELAKGILDRELDLQKLNAHLHLEAANPSFKRARRTWLWDIGNALPTEGGLIAATALYSAHCNDKTVSDVQVTNKDGQASIAVLRKRVPNHIPVSEVAGTIEPQIAGQVIGGAGSFYELSADYSRSRNLHKHQLNRGAVTRRVLAMINEIDARQAQFDLQAAANTSAKTYMAEGKVLRDIRNKSLCEFSRLEAAAAKISVGQLIEDAVSATRNTVGGVGNSINVGAILENNKRLNGKADILNLIAASMITMRPFLSNAGNAIATKCSDHTVKKNFPDLNTKQEIEYSYDTAQLRAQCQEGSISVQMAKRLSLYARQNEKFADEEDLAQKESQKNKQVIVRRFRESIYAPTKMAQSILGIVINFRRGNNATADNRLAAAANLTYTSGQVFNIFELVRERVVDEGRHSRLEATKMLPEQRIERSLETLDSMQSQLHM
jgi:hypothetical protein